MLYARRAVQATSNLAPKVVGGLVRMACRALALIKRDEGVNIVNHVAALNIQGADEQRMLRKPSPNDRVVQVLPAGALDDKPDRDMIAGSRFITNGPNCEGITLNIT